MIWAFWSVPHDPERNDRQSPDHWAKNIRNTLRKQGFLTFFFNFDDISKFVPFGGNLSTRTQ